MQTNIWPDPLKVNEYEQYTGLIHRCYSNFYSRLGAMNWRYLNKPLLRIAHHLLALDMNNIGGAILTASLLYIGVPEGFYDLSVINFSAKTTFNRLLINA